MKAIVETIRVSPDISNAKSVFASREPPRLRFVGSINCGPAESFHQPLHNNPDATEIELVLEGDQDVLIDGTIYRVGPGDLFVLNQGLWHEERNVAGVPLRAVYAQFHGLQAAGLPPGYLTERVRSPVIAMGDRAFAVEQRFGEIARTLNERAGQTGTIADHLLAILLAEIAEAALGKQSAGDGGRSEARLVIAAQRYIQANYGRPLTLADIGDAASTGRFHLCRAFRSATGYSPIEYLVKYRVEVAKEILRSTDETMSVISERVGYQSETHFQTVFRRVAGMPPGRYRRMARSANLIG